MSYSRFGFTDAYIYDSVSEGLYCASCLLKGDGSGFVAGSNYKLMIKHIKEHQSAGHDIPDEVITQILRDFA